MMELITTHLLDLSHTLAGEYLKQFVSLAGPGGHFGLDPHSGGGAAGGGL